MVEKKSETTVFPDPVPGLVEGRFRVIGKCKVAHHHIGEEAFDRRLYEAYRLARRLDERIVRTVPPRRRGSLPSFACFLHFMRKARTVRVAVVTGARLKPPDVVRCRLGVPELR
jgi:hypothetical protein